MSSEHNDTLALKLLNSQDSKVAEAARRIFSNTSLGTDTTQKLPVKENPSTNIMEHGNISPVSSEIQEAASAVVMLAPQHQNLIHIRQSGTSFGISEEIKQHESITTSIIGRRAATPSERVKRSRERNKMHARKTRQRKKEHMQGLEKRVNDLKSKQISMKQLINEKATANILLCLAPRSSNITSSTVDPKVEALIQRPNREIPDASRIPDLPVLILPGANSKKRKAAQMSVGEVFLSDSQYPDDGIDYELLGKDRSTCTPEELDKIRRERNRMHAKRTRDRKRIFMEQLEEITKTLQSENLVLEKHLTEITKDSKSNSTGLQGAETPSLTSPSLAPSFNKDEPETYTRHEGKISVQDPSIMGRSLIQGSKDDKAVVFNISSHTSLKTDIKPSVSTKVTNFPSNITVSDDGASSQSSSHVATQKGPCSEGASAVPTSITTNSSKAVRC